MLQLLEQGFLPTCLDSGIPPDQVPFDFAVVTATDVAMRNLALEFVGRSFPKALVDRRRRHRQRQVHDSAVDHHAGPVAVEVAATGLRFVRGVVFGAEPLLHVVVVPVPGPERGEVENADAFLEHLVEKERVGTDPDQRQQEFVEAILEWQRQPVLVEGNVALDIGVAAQRSRSAAQIASRSSSGRHTR